jgi:putative ABC transport system permease protein
MPDWSKQIRPLLIDIQLEAAREAEIVEELTQHLNDAYEDGLANGLSPQEAERVALAPLRDGTFTANLRSIMTVARPAFTPGRAESRNILASIWQDLRFGGRLLRLSPIFAVIATLSLALGIGANTAIFQLLDAVRLRSLPVKNPQELVDIRVVDNPYGRTGTFAGHNSQLTNAIWEQLRERQQAFSGIAAWGSDRLNLREGGEAQYADVLWVSGGFFETLGVRSLLGRLISAADDTRGCASPGAVISYSFWQAQFGGDGSVLGRKVTLEGHPLEIVGVTPANFFGVEVGRKFDVALPLCVDPIISDDTPRINNPEIWWLASIARLKPGWTAERASVQLAAISPGIFNATLPPDYDPIDRQHYLGFKLGATSAIAGVSALRREYETPLWLLMGISAMVLLIACANLANLMMARASTRQREMAVRVALGASRSRLMRQVLAESLVLAVLGGVCGALLAQGLSRFLVAFLSTQSTTLFLNLHPDWRVLAFTGGLAILTCLLFGLTPAIQASHTAPGEAIKVNGRGLTATRHRFGLRRALVVTQVALSLVLLVSALLFVQTLQNLSNLDAGFQQNNILISDVDLSHLQIPTAQRLAFKRELLTRLRAIPGITSVAQVVIVPVSGKFWNDNVNVQGSDAQRRVSNFNRVSPQYFQTMGTPVMAGRDFLDTDTASSPRVAIVNQTFARKFFGRPNPVGSTFGVVQGGGKPDELYEVVGLVKDTKYNDLREEFTSIAFLSEAQDEHPDLEAQFVVRSTEPLLEIASSVKTALAEIHPAMVVNFRVFRTTVREGLLRERLMATLSGFFGALAAVLAMIGLYGVISYMVIRRTNEIGIRMALGAKPRGILTMVLREAASLLGIGLAIGTVLAVLGAMVARGLLFGLRPNDPMTVFMAIAMLAAVAMVASYLPARCVANVNPIAALRDE